VRQEPCVIALAWLAPSADVRSRSLSPRTDCHPVYDPECRASSFTSGRIGRERKGSDPLTVGEASAW